MSRYIKQVEINEEIQKELKEITDVNFELGEYELAYGYDHATFYFYQFFYQEDDVFFEEDTLFNGLSGSKLGSILRLFDCGSHSMMCYLDMAI